MRSQREYSGCLQVQTDDLVHKVVGAGKLKGVLSGDWDLNFVLLSNTAKHRSMMQRFVQGMEWEQTEIFLDLFPRRFAGGLSFRGSFDLRAVAAYYRKEVDPVFASLKKDGFRPINPPKALIARTGEVMLGDQGNHRVAMAKILGIKIVPCMIVCRHADYVNGRRHAR